MWTQPEIIDLIEMWIQVGTTDLLIKEEAEDKKIHICWEKILFYFISQ